MKKTSTIRKMAFRDPRITKEVKVRVMRVRMTRLM